MQGTHNNGFYYITFPQNEAKTNTNRPFPNPPYNIFAQQKFSQPFRHAWRWVAFTRPSLPPPSRKNIQTWKFSLIRELYIQYIENNIRNTRAAKVSYASSMRNRDILPPFFCCCCCLFSATLCPFLNSALKCSYRTGKTIFHRKYMKFDIKLISDVNRVQLRTRIYTQLLSILYIFYT